MNSNRSLHALYVEDNPTDVRLFTRYLETAGFDVTADAVTTESEFLAALGRHKYDVILADHGLPAWSGAGALEALQREENDTPLIFVSGTISDDSAVECVKRGATDYILKDRLARLPHAVEKAMTERATLLERKKAERTRDYLASLVETASEALIGLSLDGTILTWNRGAREIFGHQPGEILGKPISTLIAPGSAYDFGKTIASQRLGQSAGRQHTEGIRADGKRVHLTISISELDSRDGQLPSASAIIQDVTEYHLLEEELRQSQKLESIGRLAGGIAHDFNNLLTVINGYSDMIAGRLQSHERYFYEISQIQKAGRDAATLIKQLLAFGRKQVLQPERLDLNQLVRSCLPMLSRLLTEDIEVSTELSPQPLPVVADAVRINQVLMNLTANARDAMPGGGHLFLRSCVLCVSDDAPLYRVDPGVYAMLEVRDTGSGMPAEVQKSIFEPFFTTKGRTEGTGLGLATSYGIVKQSGGVILVRSEVGRGSTFQILLPMSGEMPAATPATPRAWQRSNPSSTGGLILLVDDKDDVRRFTSVVLHSAGYEVVEAANAQEALALSDSVLQQASLLLTDIVMPGMNGLDLASELRRRRREWLPVMGISGYPIGVIEQTAHLPAHMVLVEKPFTPDYLLAKITSLLQDNPVTRP